MRDCFVNRSFEVLIYDVFLQTNIKAKVHKINLFNDILMSKQFTVHLDTVDDYARRMRGIWPNIPKSPPTTLYILVIKMTDGKVIYLAIFC